MEDAKLIVSGNKAHRPLMDYTLTEQDKYKALVELNEVVGDMHRVVDELRQRLFGDDADFESRHDEEFLIRFLRVRKFNVDQAYDCVKDYYKFRRDHRNFILPPSAVKNVLLANVFNYLPHRDHLGRAIFVFKMANWNPLTMPYTHFVAAGHLMSEYVLKNPVTQINGFIGIWDYSGFNAEHFKEYCFPNNIFVLLRLMQDCFPGRLKVAYCIYGSHWLHKAWRVFRVVLRRKYQDRLVFIKNDMAELHKYVDPSILPFEYGGQRPMSNGAEMSDLVLNNEHEYYLNLNYGY